MEKKNTGLKKIVIGGLLLTLFCVGSAFGLHATSTTEFCLSCHEMQLYQHELKFSSHAKDKDGNPIGCAQCHLPRGFGPKYLAAKIYSGTKDLAIHILESPEQLNRVQSQKVARRFVDDANCLHCHADLYKDGKGEKAISEIGKLAHDAYLGKNGQAKSNCVGCHRNLAHLPDFDRRYTVNERFTSKIVQEEGQR